MKLGWLGSLEKEKSLLTQTVGSVNSNSLLHTSKGIDFFASSASTRLGTRSNAETVESYTPTTALRASVFRGARYVSNQDHACRRSRQASLHFGATRGRTREPSFPQRSSRARFAARSRRSDRWMVSAIGSHAHRFRWCASIMMGACEAPPGSEAA